jgi:flavin reductase (DIM6/NTAB) family NADH-FMN oxidoreductase RutF
MEFSVAGLPEKEAYAVFTQVVIPRPIAWVLSDNGSELGEQRWNLAPFSYFNGISSSPPLVMFSIGDGMAEREKDSHRNLRQRPEFVISLASCSQVDAVHATSAELPPGVSEPVRFGIDLAAWDWPVPRVAESPLSMACIARQFTRVGNTDQTLVFAEILKLWVRPDVGSLDARGRLSIDVAAFDPLARVGKGAYARLSDVFRPTTAGGKPGR